MRRDSAGFDMLRDLSKVGLVVPCYNEAHRLPVQEFVGFCEQFPGVYLLFVNDGSADGTGALLQDLATRHAGRMGWLNLETNRGKAEAVRAGMNELLAKGNFRLIGYWDADLATPLTEIPRLVEAFDHQPALQLVCGSRVRRLGAAVDRLWYRHYLGRVFATCVSLILRLPVYDSQCGAKFMTASLGRKLFESPFISRWFFDVELFARTIQALGWETAQTSLFEVPVAAWHEKGGSRLRLADFLRAPWELLVIHRHYRLHR